MKYEQGVWCSEGQKRKKQVPPEYNLGFLAAGRNSFDELNPKQPFTKVVFWIKKKFFMPKPLA